MPTSSRPQALLVIRRAGCPHPAARPRTALPAEISVIARSGATWQSVPLKAPLHLVMHTGAVICPLLSYLSYPIFQKKQGFPCEFFVISPTSSFFLLPNAPTCSKITPLTVLRVKLRSRSCAMDAHESCQAGNRAALRGIIHVPQGRRLCGFMGRTIYFHKNSKGVFMKRLAARCGLQILQGFLFYY